jgi:hypothetical protein
MTRNVFLTLAGAAAVGLIAAGCGGGNDDASSPTGTEASAALSRAEFISQADAICKASGDEIDAAGQALGKSPTGAELDAFTTDTVVPGIQSQLDQVGQLNPPEADQATIDSILASAQSVLDQVKADPGELRTNQDPFADVNKQTQAYGFKECGA